MDANVVTQEAGNRIKGAKLRDSFVASLHTRAACEDLQRQFEAVARPEDAAVPNVQAYVDFVNRVAERKFAEYLVIDREIRHAKNVCASFAEQRDAAATQVAAVLAPAKRASDELLPERGYKLWLHGPVGRTPTSLHRQAEDVAWWGQEAREDLGRTVLDGIRLDVDALVAEIEGHNGKLAGALGSHEEAALHLEAVRKRASKAGEACDQSYLQVKATLEAVCRLGGQSEAVAKYGPPSLRKLQRTKKRKRKGVVAEQVIEDALTQSDSLAAAPPVLAQESDLAAETRSLELAESDLQTGTCSPELAESDLQTERSSPELAESDLQTGKSSTGICGDESAVPDGSRRERRRVLAVTGGRVGSRGRLSALTSGPWGSRRGRLSVTEGVCGPRGSRSEVTDAVRSPENRGGDPQEGVTARIPVRLHQRSKRRGDGLRQLHELLRPVLSQAECHVAEAARAKSFDDSGSAADPTPERTTPAP